MKQNIQRKLYNAFLRCKILVFFLFVISAKMHALDLYVGDTYNCDIGYIQNLRGCQWTISDINAIEFVTFPGAYDTQVQIRAIAPQETTTPVVVHCKYYYLELDPISGRYIYERTSYKRWTFFIKRQSPQSVSIYPSSLELNINETYNLSSSVYPSSADQSVSWQSTDNNIVSVNYNGTITANDVGEAKVIATTINGNTATCIVKVTSNFPESIKLSENNISLYLGESHDLDFSVYPLDASKSVTWTTDNKSVAQVSSTGLVTSVGCGHTTIRVITRNNLSSICEVEVKPISPEVLKLKADEFTLGVGERLKLEYTIIPTNASYILKWNSNAPDVVDVDSLGNIFAKSSGNAKIMVNTDNGLVAECLIKVPPLPKSIEIQDSLSLGLYREHQILYKFLPDGSFANIEWYSDNPNICLVSDIGKVIPIGVGKAEIRAKTDNGVDASCSIYVPEPNYSVYVWTSKDEYIDFPFIEKPVIEFKNGFYKIYTRNNEFEYKATDVIELTLIDKSLINDNKLTNLVNLNIKNGVKCLCINGKIIVTGLRKNDVIDIISIDGTIINSLKADSNGSCVFNIGNISKCIYIIRTPYISFKILV